jgi:hypothetical protein
MAPGEESRMLPVARRPTPRGVLPADAVAAACFPALYRIARSACARWLSARFDLDVSGVQHLPALSSFIVVANPVLSGPGTRAQRQDISRRIMSAIETLLSADGPGRGGRVSRS